MKVIRPGRIVPVIAPEKGERVLIRRAWKGETDVEIELRSRARLVPWPPEKPAGAGIFDGPLCLGLPADAGDVSLPWTVLTDGAGRPQLDPEGRPLLLDPSGLTTSPLEPVSARRLLPDVKDPLRRRVLFSKKRFD